VVKYNSYGILWHYSDFQHNPNGYQNYSKNVFFKKRIQGIEEENFESVSKHTNGRLNAKVLVLNQSYEPITICNIRKAIVLLILQKAEMISTDGRKFIRSVNGNFQWPSVIRLSRFVSVPYKRVVLSRKNILRRDLFKCAYCGRGDLPLTIDHIIPKAKGGIDSWENLVSACTKCNNLKGDRSPSEAGMKLLFQPFKPNHLLFIKNAISKIDESWKPYLYIS